MAEQTQLWDKVVENNLFSKSVVNHRRSSNVQFPDHDEILFPALVDDILEVLKNFDGFDSLKILFWDLLSYEPKSLPVKTSNFARHAREHLHSLEIFAEADQSVILIARCGKKIGRYKAERLCRNIKARMNNALLLLNRPEKGWVLIYPDETKDRFLRSLPLPGPFHKREITARAIASLNAVHPETGEAFGQFDIDSRLETFFPGDMPRLSEDFGGFETFLKVIRPKLSKIEPYIREISKYPLLTVPQERGDDIDLNKTAPDGSGLSYWRWRLIVHNLRLVVYIALKFSAKGMQLEDLIQEGTLGLFRATETFDPHKGNRFSTYACYWIQQRVYRSLYRNSNLIRWPSYKAAELVKANRSGRREELKLGERFVKSATEEWEEIESIPDPDDWGLNKAIRDDIKDEVLKAVNDFPEREAKIMKCRWALGGYKKKTLAELSIVFGISRERVRQIENECKKKLTYSLRHLVNQRIFLQKVKQFK